MDSHTLEIERGERFGFGANWARYLNEVDDRRIAAAERSLRQMLECERLDGKSFLDIGSGSGLFSLAAHRLGARVHSLDYDPDSVSCTRELRKRYTDASEEDWPVESGSALDADYLRGLGSFDIVYSWGVLHHTGDMWSALDNVAPLVAPGGRLFISLYDDEGGRSRRWTKVKKAYCGAGAPMRGVIVAGSLLACWGGTTAREILKGKPFHSWRNYDGGARGMSPWRDLIDWVGGYPFEVATPGEVLDFYRQRGFELLRLVTTRGGCNEYVFRRKESGGEEGATKP